MRPISIETEDKFKIGVGPHIPIKLSAATFRQIHEKTLRIFQVNGQQLFELKNRDAVFFVVFE